MNTIDFGAALTRLAICLYTPNQQSLADSSTCVSQSRRLNRVDPRIVVVISKISYALTIDDCQAAGAEDTKSKWSLVIISVVSCYSKIGYKHLAII